MILVRSSWSGIPGILLHLHVWEDVLKGASYAAAMLKRIEFLDPRAKQIVEELLVTLIGHWKELLPMHLPKLAESDRYKKLTKK